MVVNVFTVTYKAHTAQHAYLYIIYNMYDCMCIYIYYAYVCVYVLGMQSFQLTLFARTMGRPSSMAHGHVPCSKKHRSRSTMGTSMAFLGSFRSRSRVWTSNSQSSSRSWDRWAGILLQKFEDFALVQGSKGGFTSRNVECTLRNRRFTI